MTLALKLALAALALYALLAWGAPRLERRLLYFPDTRRVAPGDAGLSGVEEKIVRAPDGAEIILWWGRAKPGQPTLLYFHGNGGSLAGRAGQIAAYLDRGQGVAMMTYRGYGGSTGEPSERVNVADAVLAYDHLVSWGVAPEDIILYGESLGSGVAVQVAASRPAGGLILDAPYTSIVDVGAAVYPYLPARLLMRDRYETMRFIGDVKAPLLVVHGDRDEVIPVEMGRRVSPPRRNPRRSRSSRAPDTMTTPISARSRPCRTGSGACAAAGDSFIFDFPPRVRGFVPIRRALKAWPLRSRLAAQASPR